MVDMFKYPTVSALAAYIGRDDEPAPAARPSPERAETRREAARRQKDTGSATAR